MNRFNASALCLLLAAGCGGSGTPTPGGGAPLGVDSTFISGARLVLGDGSAPIENATMLLNEGKIVQIGKEKELKAPKGSLALDMEGRTIIPMLINLNAYPGLSNAGEFGAKNYNRESLTSDLIRYAYYGVTAVVAGGDSDGLALQVRDEQKQGKAQGAQLHSSGRGIAAKGGTSELGNIPIRVGSEDEARKAVSELADRKADAIVLWADGMNAAISAAVIDEAHKRKLKVFADAPGLSEAKDVVKAGGDALIGSVRDREVDDDLISLLKEKKVSLAPALSSLEARFMYTEKVSWLGEPAMREVYPSQLLSYLTSEVVVNKMRRNPETASYRQQFAIASKNLKKLADAGVTISFGSGSGLPDTFPGYFEHRELELMVMAGLSPMDAIKAATVSSAEALGAADLGALTAGKKANFMVLTDNPLDKITNTKGMDAVFIDGKQVDRVELKRHIKVIIPEITQAAKTEERNAQIQEQTKAIEDKMTHYGNGKFVLAAESLRVATGLSLQTPRRSKATVSSGPPYRVSVTFGGAAGADLRAFYAETLKAWTVAGNCWEKAVPGDESKKFRVCPEPSAGQIILNIAVQ